MISKTSLQEHPKTIQPNGLEPLFSQEFKSAAQAYINLLKNQQLQLFLIDQLSLNTNEIKSASHLDCLKDFEKSRTKQLGAFYTPDFSGNKIVNYLKFKPDYKYLEPSVGTGNLLIKLLEKIINSFPNLSCNDILKSVYGFDLDYEALELSKLRVLVTLQKKFAIDESTYHNLNLYGTDFTVKPSTAMDFMRNFNPLYQDSEEVEKIKENMRFDYVFGNPPFVTFYGRRSCKLLESQRNYYLENYEFIPNSVKNGKLNLYMFFIEHGLQMLKHGGQLIYLLDNSIYETSAYYLRKWILENFQINLIEMGLSGFDHVLSGQTLWQITKSVPQQPVFVQDITRGYSQTLLQKVWLEDDECRVNFLEKDSIVDKLSRYRRLVNYFPNKSIRTCCMLLNLTDFFLVSEDEYYQDKTGNIMPYLEGSKSLSSPDSDLKFDHYIKYDYELQLSLSNQIKNKLEKEGVKNKKRIGLGCLEVYKSPKIFIRQSSKRLVAKFTNKNFMANNSLYVLTPIYSSFKQESWEKVLIYTEKLLCSKLYLYLAHKMQIIRQNVKQQPQIKISDLKKLPFFLDEESSVFSHILTENDRSKIDQIIYNFFELDVQEISQIEFFERFL